MVKESYIIAISISTGVTPASEKARGAVVAAAVTVKSFANRGHLAQ